MTAGPVAGLLDLDRLARWLDSEGVAAGAPLRANRLGTGRSNEMFELRRGDEHLVLRRPALVALEHADEGLQREYRMLRALDATSIPHAAPVAHCTDVEVIGSTFYVMRFVEGVMPFGPMLPPELADAGGRADVTGAIVDVLADLGAVDWQAIGLGDFGRPAGFHERQRDRWMGQYESYPRQDLPGIERAATWLAANLPRDSDWTPGIMHGDYHMGNLLIAAHPPARVVAVCDWETASIGDPLLDLAIFVRFWTEAHPAHAGWPGERAIIERYAARAGRAVPELSYYSVLARFRLAVMLEGIYQRSLADPTREVADDMHAYAARLVEELLALTA